MDTNIDNLTGTESLDELEAMLEEIEQEGDPELSDGTVTEKTDVETAPSAVEVAASTEQANAEQADEVAQVPEKVILAKSGQHTIPYDVLELARSENKALREQLYSSQQAQVERDKLQAVLEKHGINPDAEPDQLSQDEVDQLAKDFPEIGKAMAAMARKIQLLEQPAVVQPAANPVQAALQAVPDLMSWRDKDQDRFDFAIIVDEKLQVDPAWQGKSLDERFAEAARRTKLAFGDIVETAPPPVKAPSTETDKPADFIPSSPSALGQTHQAPETGVARYGAMSQTELVGEMGAMTDAQLEALLEQAGY
ncbi:hypothetical protein [Aeromonas veronii]|uniref:hypothetical protein n=1 Tax=Aeromonas veronii TaxID=654 RepID=UPI00131823E6|nr:hypothetical protein [Aeromonas veronii]MBL0492801.1 hypothetical protein [Aeromonas veronii]QHB82645.1 hypothetical protein GIS01_10925 [Aeromonas veronii]